MSTSKQIWVPVYRSFGAHKVHTAIFCHYVAAGWRVVGVYTDKETGRIEAEMERAAGPSVAMTEKE